MNDKIKKKTGIAWWEWTIVVIAFIMPLISFLYWDTNSIIRCGIDVLKSMLDGRFGDYYTYAEESKNAGLMIHSATYDIVFYLTVGIWEAPIALIEHFTGSTLQNSMWAMIYSKLFLALWVGLCAARIKKIAVLLGVSERNAHWAAFMFLTSGLIYSCVCIAGQYDIMGIYFTLLGVYYYIKNDMLRFEIFFILAVQYKFFPLFVFFPLLLLREKKVWKIIGYVALPFAVVMLLRLPFLANEGIAYHLAQNTGMLGKILGNTVTLFFSQIPISFLTVGAVCIWCFFKKASEEQLKYYAVYIPFLTFGLLFLSFSFYPYWLVYLTPWIPLLYFCRQDISNQVLWAEFGMTGGVMLANYQHYDWVFSWDNMENMFVNKVIYAIDKITNPMKIKDFLDVIKVDEYESCYYGLFVLCIVTLLILFRPVANRQCRQESSETRKDMWKHFAMQYAVGGVPFLLYVISVLRDIVMPMETYWNFLR